MTIAYQQQVHIGRRTVAGTFHPIWFISELPGEGGRGWGWTNNQQKARHLPPYWVQRFAAYCRKDSKRLWGIIRDGEMKPPKMIAGTQVKQAGEPIRIKGENWVELVPITDDRIWEFNLESGLLVQIR